MLTSSRALPRSFSPITRKRNDSNAYLFGPFDSNNNSILALPTSIGECRKLRELQVCRNGMESIPKQIGFCTALRTLWLDWNRLEELPYSIANLKKLTSVRAEGNPLNNPPSELIYESTAQQLVEWCAKRNTFDTGQRFKDVIVNLQKLSRESKVPLQRTQRRL